MFIYFDADCAFSSHVRLQRNSDRGSGQDRGGDKCEDVNHDRVRPNKGTKNDMAIRIKFSQNYIFPAVAPPETHTPVAVVFQGVMLADHFFENFAE
jgi:hypothetical protein